MNMLHTLQPLAPSRHFELFSGLQLSVYRSRRAYLTNARFMLPFQLPASSARYGVVPASTQHLSDTSFDSSAANAALHNHGEIARCSPHTFILITYCFHHTQRRDQSDVDEAEMSASPERRAVFETSESNLDS